MGEKITVASPGINRGLRNDREAFNIDNDSFPILVNAYQWRGKIKRKRGTEFLNRFMRHFSSTNNSYTNYHGANPTFSITLSGGAGNLLTGPYTNIDAPPVSVTLQANGNIVPGSVTIVDSTGPQTYTDLNEDGTLQGSLGGSGTINYATGAFTISGGGAHLVTAIFNYYPTLPVLGLEDLQLDSSDFPGNLGFDTVYSYNILNNSPYDIYDVSFYKNPPNATINGIAYTAKTSVTPTSWNGQNYQQFWSTNYQGAFWVTNGINAPFSSTNIGMQFQKPTSAVRDNATQMTFVITDPCPLVVGDWVFANEWTSTVPANANSLNFQTGFVTSSVDAAGSTTVIVRFPFANINADAYGSGLLQYLTNRSDVTKDCLRWYDGDPTNGNPTSPTLNGALGWVNFCPPLTVGPTSTFSIADLPPGQYYLVSAVAVLQFKDRLLFFGPVVQTSGPNSQKYLQDTVIYSQNGTPYYTASFDNGTNASLVSSSLVFNPLLVPINQNSAPNSFVEDATGFGGFIQAGFAQPITTINPNEDVLLIGFTNRQTRFVYTGNDIVPFNFFVVNSEFGDASTFSAITLDRGKLTTGLRGIVLSSQVAAQRIDLQIPDQIFQFNLTNQGAQRVTAQRDFINEWIYFTYPSNEFLWNFPNQTLLYNYREETWGIFNECYTTYGQFRKKTGDTWGTLDYFTWEEWNTPWGSGDTTLLQPQVIAGNQQGFVLIRTEETNEDTSLEITNISPNLTITGATQAASCVLTVNNSLSVGQMVFIFGVQGMTQLNNNYYLITAASATTITLNVNSTLFSAYTSGGTVDPAVYSPNHCLNSQDFIQLSGIIGSMGTNLNGKIFQISIQGNDANNFFLPDDVIITGTYVGGGLITRLYRPRILTKQFPTSWGFARKTRIGPQQYLFTATNNAQITLQVYLSQDQVSPYNAGNIVPSSNVQNNALVYSDILYTCLESVNLGLTSANINLQMIGTINNSGITASTNQAQIWHRMNTSLIGDTVQIGFTLSDLQMSTVDSNGDPISQFAEIELHGFVLDVQPSSLLS